MTATNTTALVDWLNRRGWKYSDLGSITCDRCGASTKVGHWFKRVGAGTYPRMHPRCAEQYEKFGDALHRLGTIESNPAHAPLLTFKGFRTLGPFENSSTYRCALCSRDISVGRGPWWIHIASDRTVHELCAVDPAYEQTDLVTPSKPSREEPDVPAYEGPSVTTIQRVSAFLPVQPGAGASVDDVKATIERMDIAWRRAVGFTDKDWVDAVENRLLDALSERDPRWLTLTPTDEGITFSFDVVVESGTTTL